MLRVTSVANSIIWIRVYIASKDDGGTTESTAEPIPIAPAFGDAKCQPSCHC
ncbi:hypothetical protein PAXRUDRAFT_723226 [Paxillus rubicundulus Ve08.2h10]|uniref:Uncharacterized protein n=1 Tax=Paxillus rubicundulus Ve08.2h10 TaxID=930991 RepID=A0A0D0DRE4_9AGAM|nr:hypothetical protein PAXRUDRAFT_723226 [Paxillus rubicundulus Ve08.2h10]